MVEIAKNIKQNRERLNYTQEYMASQLDISQPAYSKIESAKTEVTFHQLVRISRILHVDILDLIREHTTHKPQDDLEKRLKKLEDEVRELKKILKSVLVES